MNSLTKNNEDDRRDWQKDEIFMLFRSGVSVERIGNRLSMDVERVISILKASTLARYLS